MNTPPRRDWPMHASWWRTLLVAGALMAPATLTAQSASNRGFADVTAAAVQRTTKAFPERTMDSATRVGEVVRGRYDGVEGARPWRLFIPSKRGASPSMLLVVLHGCTQNADDIAAGTRMDVVAEEQGFYVLYPEQVAAANARGCWNWFDAAHQSRGSGEPAIIAAMLNDVLTRSDIAQAVDRAQIHLVGISAGAAMANLVAVAYPETFASITSASGLGWKAATDVGRALVVMQKGSGEGLQTADAMVQQMGTHARALPALVVHGGSDVVVNVRNGDETAVQWVGVHNLLRAQRNAASLTSSVAPSTRVDNAYTVHESDWRDERGVAQVTAIRIVELGHAWSGGSTTGTFTDAKGPDVTRIVAAFCASHPMRAAR